MSGLDFIKKRFSAFTINHSYSSNYSVGNFISNLDYGAAYVNLICAERSIGYVHYQQGQFVPVFAMSTITMSEKFAPLIGCSISNQEPGYWST
jgi:cell surface protein SprA